jgi:myosin X
LFEQAFEAVMNRRYPANDDTLIKLAALRTQFVVGDYEAGAYISDLVKVRYVPKYLASRRLCCACCAAIGPLADLRVDV